MPARDNYLVPVKALSRLFGGIFLGRIRRQFEDTHLPEIHMAKGLGRPL
jgi:hypothetical protein